MAAEHRHHAPPAGKDDAFAREAAAAMDRMMRDMHAAPPTGDASRDFLRMMIPHHEGAVAMARLALLHAHDPLTRELAAHILATQAVEIAAMDARLSALAAAGGPAPYPALTGLRGP